MRFSLTNLKGIVAAVAITGLSFAATPAQATEQEKMLNMIAMQNFMNQQAQAQQAQINMAAVQQAAYNQSLNQQNYNNGYWNRGRYLNNNNCYNGAFNGNFNGFNNYQNSGLGNFGRSIINRFRGW